MSRSRIVRSETPEARWEMALRPVPLALRRFVRSWCGYCETSRRPMAQPQLPHPAAVLIFELGPPLRVDGETHVGGFVAGLDEGVTVTAHDGAQAGIEVRLTPIGARALFGVPMSELTGRVVAVGDVLRGERGASARLAELSDWDARLDHVEAILTAGMARAERRGGDLGASVAAWALERIEASGGLVDVGELVRESGYSHKRVIQLFREHVGLPPKRIAGVVRFDRLARFVQRGGTEPWAALAARFGYADQAHLARDVRRYAGATPSELRARLAGIEVPHLDSADV